MPATKATRAATVCVPSNTSIRRNNTLERVNAAEMFSKEKSGSTIPAVPLFFSRQRTRSKELTRWISLMMVLRDSGHETDKRINLTLVSIPFHPLIIRSINVCILTQLKSIYNMNFIFFFLRKKSLYL